MTDEDIKYILLSRRIVLPSLRYRNTEADMNVESMSVDDKINQICNMLDRRSDTVTGVIRGEGKFFPFPLLIYVGNMILRSSGDNLTELLERGGPNL